MIERGMKYLKNILRPGKSRRIQLDLLRGIAIILVLGRHQFGTRARAGIFQVIADKMYLFGWTGVDLFFVLSGFLVGGLLFSGLRSRSLLDAERFIVRRGFKIWPAYFIYLGYLFIWLVVTESSGSLKVCFTKLLPNLLHIQNYVISVRYHTWSLAVEEHFYLLLPLYLYLVTRRRKAGIESIPSVPLIAAILVIFCTLLRYLTVKTYEYSAYAIIFPTHLRIDSLFFGVLISYLYYFKPDLLRTLARRRAALFLCGLALVYPMIIVHLWGSVFVCTIGFVMLYMGYGCILVSMLYPPEGSRLWGWFFNSYIARVIAFVGFYSYSIYLWHVDIGFDVVGYLLKHGTFRGLRESALWLLTYLMYVLLSVVGGVVMGVIVERPALALRDRLYPSRSSAV